MCDKISSGAFLDNIAGIYDGQKALLFCEVF